MNDAAARTVYTVGPHFEVEVAGSVTAYRSTVYFGPRAVFARLSSTQTGLLEEYYLHRDHLGSVDKLTPATTNLAAQGYRFDAFGKRRNGNWTADSGDTLLADTTVQWTERGYTGHEHLDAVKLIHMNGRIQDPILGRMISADPLLGDLADPQSLNRYSYVRNNPLGLTDPSGFSGTCDAPESCPAEIVVRTPPPLTGVELHNWDSFVERTLDAWMAKSAEGAVQTVVETAAPPTPVYVESPLTGQERELIEGLATSIRNAGPEGRVLADRSTAKAVGKLGSGVAPLQWTGSDLGPKRLWATSSSRS